MKRLLCIVGCMNAGGAETFLMKIYRELDKTKYQMDFAVAVQEKGFYDDEIISMGGKIYHITPKSDGVMKNFNSIKRLVSEERYQYVLRTSQHSLSALELFSAWLGGARTRVFRSSNSNTTTGKGMDLKLHKLCMFMPKLFANVRIAPSTEAAEFMFGRKSIINGNASIIHNGIKLSDYKYNISNREDVRHEFKINDSFVVGHIGRFNQQKNHKKLIGIFAELKKQIPTSILMLVGKGELEKELKMLIGNLGLEDSVIFTGVRDDIPRLLSAMDVFVFPSLYEGMPNTVIEAQASGLPCYISDSITKEANITGNVIYLSNNDYDSKWASTIVNSKMHDKLHDRGKYIDIMKSKGYDIEDTTKEFVSRIYDI